MIHDVQTSAVESVYRSCDCSIEVQALQKFMRRPLISCVPGYTTSLFHPSVGTCPDRGHVMEVESGAAVSCLLLPKIDVVEVVNLSVNTGELGDFFENRDEPPDTHRLLAILGIPEGRTPRMILWFGTEYILYEDEDGDLSQLLLKHYGNVVIAGGLVDYLLPQPDDETG